MITSNENPFIDTSLVKHLVAVQFPQWADLPVQGVAQSGWDHRTFHLGKEMLVRLPSAAKYAGQVAKEQRWLPHLAPLLPLAIPTPLALGKPTAGFPWEWSVYRWLPGDSASLVGVSSLVQFADDLAAFLKALQSIPTAAGPVPDRHNFFRGGSLATYHEDVQQALSILHPQLDSKLASEQWQAALAASWSGPAVWVHGDISPGNLLVQQGRLTAVIDFGLLAVGDPACDLVVGWTLFHGESRRAFRAGLNHDDATWLRAWGWALWKAASVAARIYPSHTMTPDVALHTCTELLRAFPSA